MSLDTPPLDDPNFDLYADQRGRIIGSCTAFIVLTTIVVVLRLLSRKLAHAGFWYSETIGPDPILELKNGYGRHIYIWGEVEGPLKMRQWRKILYVFELFFHTSTTLAKYSIQPIRHAWDQVVGASEGHCINEYRFFVGSGSANAVLNVLVFILVCLLRNSSSSLILTFPANATPMAVAHNRTTANYPYSHLHSGRLVSILDHLNVPSCPILIGDSVVLVSIIWVVVLAELKASNVTCKGSPLLSLYYTRITHDRAGNFINAGIWSALEPSMAVICACIPSLRPLFSLASRSLRNSNVPSFSTPRIVGGKFTGPSSSKQRTWPRSGKGKISDGMFSQLDEGGADDTKPLGHDVSVHGGGETEEGIELPERGIQVKTEVRVSSEGLEYRDRLF
ncbi:MAG: hypothetical protein Q9176_005894 [Flavoplaca citrina]